MYLKALSTFSRLYLPAVAAAAAGCRCCYCGLLTLKTSWTSGDRHLFQQNRCYLDLYRSRQLTRGITSLSSYSWCNSILSNNVSNPQFSTLTLTKNVNTTTEDSSKLSKSKQDNCLPRNTMAACRSRSMSSDNSPPSISYTNRLVDEKSPYLLQHAHNPVNWFPWGEEAFKKSREENKPIFLSVGYSTCHWCHVMERESFENPEIGRILNNSFVSIKVDREERPDVNKVYMTFVQATSGGGGWPMSVWLTPDLKPIVGGTYFPPDDRYYGRPGFKTILNRISEQWQENQSDMKAQGAKIMDAIGRAVHASDSGQSMVPGRVTAATLFASLDQCYDDDRGGFGSAPKFPQPVNFGALFRIFHSDQDGEMGLRSLEMCLHTLSKMAAGGINDHVSKGFHRYSTDASWQVPHFEKMLYDQGQLAVTYCEAFQITNDPFYADVARDIFTYVNRDLSHPAGGFYSAEDADSLPTADSTEKKEGAFCVWEFDSLQSHLRGVEGAGGKNSAEIFCHHFGVKSAGNVDPLQDPHGELTHQNVLIAVATREETAAEFDLTELEVKVVLDQCLHHLHEVRQDRPRPHLDNKMVAGWNGLMISGFAKGAQILGDPELCSRGVQAAEFLKQHLFVPESGVLLRSAYTSATGGVEQTSRPIEGFCDDYAYVIRGLLDLYEATLDPCWLEWTEQLMGKQVEKFWDAENGGFFTSAEGDESIVLRMKDDQDGAEPSANSVSTMNLLRLAAMLDKPEWYAMANRMFRVFAERLEKVPHALPELVSALLFYHSTPKQIILVGDRDSPDTQSLVKVVHKSYLPHKVLLLTSGQENSFLSQCLSVVKSLKKRDGQATAYVCHDFTCSLPTTCPEELEKQLES